MNTQRLVDFTQRLVHQPSLSGEEQAVIQIVINEMGSLGFDKIWVDENGSAIGIMEGTQPGKTLLFDAHCDTVGIAPGSTWTRDPFGGEIIDGYLYGRGCADMKGALAAMVHAAASVDKSKLSGRIVVSASVMEEVFEGGALKTVMDQVNPDYVVIGESSDLNLVHGGRGRAEIHLETIGKPSHSSSPQLGVNAVHLMMKVIEAVDQIELSEHPRLGPAILALTDIISEPYPGYSVIPSRCKATYDRRLLPDETIEDVLSAITSLPELKNMPLNVIIAQGEHQSYAGITLRGTKFFPAWELDAKHPFVERALKGLRTSGLDAHRSTYRFCTNAAYSIGIAGIPTIGFGPGTEADAHVVDERLSLDSLEKAARGYQGIMEAVLSRNASR